MIEFQHDTTSKGNTSMLRYILLFCMGVLMSNSGYADSSAVKKEMQKAVFAGGCFWCLQKSFDTAEGVTDTRVGYAGGNTPSPTYKAVSAGGTGHLEVFEVTYDASKVAYETLLEIFFANVDPIDDGGQFCDRGESYKTAIFYNTDEQKTLAETAIKKLNASGLLSQKIATPIRKLDVFYEGEEYHQDYYIKNPIRYKYYRYRCGRDARLEELWGDKKKLELF